jgi:hypothetical protein
LSLPLPEDGHNGTSVVSFDYHRVVHLAADCKRQFPVNGPDGATIHVWFNIAEAAVWVVIGAALVIWSRTFAARQRRVGLVAGVTFIAFAATDVVEVQTGAWYRPWWLFVGKAACLVVLGTCYGIYLVRKPRAGGD